MRPVINAAGSQHSSDHGADLIEPIWWGDDGEDEVGAGGVCVGKVQELPDGKELYFFHSEVLSKTKSNLFCM